MPHFHALEWNALVNRAWAILRARNGCLDHSAYGTPGHACPLAASTSPGTRSGQAACCYYRFRATLDGLSGMVWSAPTSYRHQLRRTLDRLELENRHTWNKGGEQ